MLQKRCKSDVVARRCVAKVTSFGRQWTSLRRRISYTCNLKATYQGNIVRMSERRHTVCWEICMTTRSTYKGTGLNTLDCVAQSLPKRRCFNVTKGMSVGCRFPDARKTSFGHHSDFEILTCANRKQPKSEVVRTSKRWPTSAWEAI